jgi:hypothetical protein
MIGRGETLENVRLFTALNQVGFRANADLECGTVETLNQIHWISAHRQYL